jgi:E3 ubiquitin-protein ligase UBR1
MESTLHLIHTCSLETAINVEKYGTFYKNFFYHSEKLQASIASLLYEILAIEKLKKHHSKIRYIFKIFESKYDDVTELLKDTIPDFTPRKLEINTIPTLDETESERKKRIAQERQAKLLAKFKKQQSLFLKNNVETSEYSDIEMEVCDDDKSWKFPEQHCILCQNAAEHAGPFGIITYISKSSEFRNVPFNDKYWFLRSFSDCANLDDEEHDHSLDSDCQACSPRSPNWSTFMSSVEEGNVVGPGFSNPAQVESKLVSTSCGHGMHFQCYTNFLTNNKNRLSQITRNSPENSEHKEFLCPLCKALNNMFIPVLWTSNKRDLADYLLPSAKSDPFEYLTNELVQDNDWFGNFTTIADKDIDNFSILTPPSMDIISLNGSQDLSPAQLQFKSLLEGLFQTTSLLTFPQVYKADCIFLLANSIKSTEISLRGVSSDDELVINQLSNNCLINLRVLNEFRNTCIMMKIKNWIPIRTPRSDAYAKMMTIILSLSLSSFNASILEVDFFDCLVNIIPIPSIGMSFNCVVGKCFLGLLIQNLNILVSELSAQNYYMNDDYNFDDIPTIPHTDKDSAIWAATAFKQLRAPQGTTYQEQNILDDERFGYVIYSLLVKATTPFLRRAAILASVQCADSNSIDFSTYSKKKVEADRLCAFLNIKTISECLELFVSGSSYERVVFQNFVDFLKTTKPNELMDTRKSMEYPGIIKLCDLPTRLDFFFSNYYYLEKYNYPYTFIEDPAVCLFCGEIVDAQKRGIGCKEGQCTTHYLKECPNNIGIFLLPKERTLLLLHRNGGSFHNGPFLDQHGELPGESKKAKALYLMKPRYNDFIKNVWLQHNVPNIIVRNLDSVLDAGGWDTM